MARGWIVLSVQNPWSDLIFRGIKDVDNRNWTTDYLRKLYNHSSGRPMSTTEACDALGSATIRAIPELRAWSSLAWSRIQASPGSSPRQSSGMLTWLTAFRTLILSGRKAVNTTGYWLMSFFLMSRSAIFRENSSCGTSILRIFRGSNWSR